MAGICLVNSLRRGLFRECARAMRITVNALRTKTISRCDYHRLLEYIDVSYVEILAVENLLTIVKMMVVGSTSTPP